MAYTIEEFVDFVEMDLTIFGTLPKTLPEQAIRQFVEISALPWFYNNYLYAVSEMYYYVDKHGLERDPKSGFSFIRLPCEIQTVKYVRRLKGTNLMQLGLNTPNLSVNLGVTNQPYLSSYVSTIGELASYKSVIDSMSDMLDQFSLFSAKYHFNYTTHQLNILTNVETNLILECTVNIPNENLFSDPLFIKYCTGWARQQQGNLMGRYDFNLPGSVKVNTADMISQGKDEMKEAIEEVNSMKANGSFLYMVKR